MDRLVLLFACVAQIGCQSPTGFSPFGARQTRVPPPPTGVIGGDDYYSSPAPTDGSYIPPSRVPGEQITSVGPWRYWESANRNRQEPNSRSNSQSVASRAPQNLRTAASPNRNDDSRAIASNTQASQPLKTLKKSDRLAWQEPKFGTAYNNSSYSEFAQQQLPVGLPASPTSGSYAPIGSGYAPRLLPQTGPVAPLASQPVRIRSFPNSYSSQPLGIPVELAQFQNNGVRQASATSDWQRRYDDVRR